jgi:hypothetical protein
MYSSKTIESMIAREKRRDLLHRVEQDRLIYLAKAGRKPGVRTGHRAQGGLSIRMIWRKAITKSFQGATR